MATQRPLKPKSAGSTPALAAYVGFQLGFTHLMYPWSVRVSEHGPLIVGFHAAKDSCALMLHKHWPEACPCLECGSQRKDIRRITYWWDK